LSTWAKLTHAVPITRFIAIGMLGCQGGPMDAREEWAYATGLQAAVWGHPLTSYLTTNAGALSAGAARVNDLRKFTTLKTAADRYVVTPNNVTIDAYAIFDVRAEPVVVHVPALSDRRWYIVQIGDYFDEVVHNVGGIAGHQPGDYLITGPDFRGEVPGNMRRVSSRTTQGVVAVRIFAAGQDDLPAAVDAQTGFALVPLSVYLEQGIAARDQADPPVPQIPRHAPAELEFFERLGCAMQLFLPVSADSNDPRVTSLRSLGLTVADGFEPGRLDDATRAGLARAAAAVEPLIDQAWAQLGETTNGWRYNFAGGRAGHDLLLRAALAKNVLGAQLASEVIYPPSDVDADGNPYDGNYAYQLHFPAGQQPPVSVFWNLNLFGPDMFFVENDAHRYSIGSTTDGLTAHPDGSLTIHIQHEEPTDPEQRANWLPAPQGSFNLALRFYGPEAPVFTGAYRLPAVTKK
jgi:hypothetical protein